VVKIAAAVILVLLVLALFALQVVRLQGKRRVQAIWGALDVQPTGELFSPEMVSDLPEVARRYLTHAIRAGTPLPCRIALRVVGSFRTSPNSQWLPMVADARIDPQRGFVWRAKVGHGLLRLVGADYFYESEGRVDFWLWGLLPVARASGRDVSRSALGRLALESVLVPSSMLPQRGARWEAFDKDSARVVREIDGETVALTLRVDERGGLRSVLADRWGDPANTGKFGLIPFGVDFEGEADFSGCTLPAQMRAGWWYGHERYFEFYRARIVAAELR